VAALLAGSCLALPAATTAQVRTVQAVDGALSRPAAGDRAAVALDWARAHRGALGMTANDVDALELTARVTSPGTGFTHLRYRRSDRGIPAFDGGLRVSLDRGGRVLSAIAVPAPQVGSAAPRLGAVEALRALQRDVGVERRVGVVSGPSGVRRTTRFEGGDFARLVLFGSGRGTRLAWHLTYRASDAEHYDAVVDATSGAVLFRQNLVKDAVPAEVFPSHPAQSASIPVDFTPWLDPGATVLEGPYAHVYSDPDDDPLTAGEEIQKTGGGFVFPFQAFGGLGCAPTALCSWDPNIPGSWEDNRKQNGVQAFYLVNRFRNHLANDPNIGFDGFRDADPVLVETDDGASTALDGPDDEHVNNASMATLPEGTSPRMELFLFVGDGFRTVNGGDSAAIVWHEYTHGLSNRLVVHGDGTGALSSPQAGAMGEGWSDWYALDLLVGDGLMDDTAAPGDVDVGHYVDFDPHQVRTQGIDCPAGVVDLRCPGGGYTYGDFAHIAGRAEVHADGEIWAQTLWDLREAVGRDTAQALITEGMRMAPPEPSFLDMRNAILAADAGLGGSRRSAIWQVFAGRGMGYLAYSEDAGDVAPRQDFSLPPAGARGVATGTVTSAESGLSLGNASVGLASLTGEAAFAERLETVTAANGSYALGAPAGTYGALTVDKPGYDPVSLRGFAVPGARDVALRRDWAASDGGGFVFRNDPPYDDSGAPFGCGLTKLIDRRTTSGWSAVNSGAPVALVRLPVAIDVTGLGLDPTNTCGNGEGASTRGFKVETSSDGVVFTTALTGSFSAAHRGSLHLLPTDRRNVRYVRLTLLSALDAGSAFVDVSELAVYGAPPNTLPSGSLAASRVIVPTGGTVEFAASFTDPDSRITGYDWDFDGNGSVDRSTGEATTSFTYTRAGDYAPTVAVRDYRGGAGTATRPLTVTATRKPVVKLPRRGRGGKATARVTCAERCTVTARVRIGGRTVRTVRRTLATTAERRIALTLPRKVRRQRRSVRTRLTVRARYGDGRSTTARRTVRIAL
jgi:extracellular elastinolytic metalloproteinase